MNHPIHRLPLVLALAGCHVPEDGVLSVAFLLEPPPASESRQLPPEDLTGLSTFAFAEARGRCDAEVATKTVRCAFEGVPPGAPGKAAFAYQLAFLIAPYAIPARFDGRAVERDPGGHDPDKPPPPMAAPLPRESLGAVTPDPLGKARRDLEGTEIPLDRVIGGELLLLVNRLEGAPARFVVIDGRVGNMASNAPGTEPASPRTGGGHQH